MAKYDQKYCEDEITTFLNENDLWRLYKPSFIKTGHGSYNSSKYYADFLMKNGYVNKFEEINSVERENEYLLDHSKCEFKQTKKGTWTEKNSLKKIVKEKRDIKELGVPFDFQIPLKNVSKEENKKYSDYGEIDLLVDSKRGTIYMVEAKKIDTEQDTALSAIIEIVTYYYQLGKDGRNKILKEAAEKYKCNAKKIKMAVLFFSRSKPANDIKNSELKNVLELAKKLDVKIVIADPNELGF